jgi:hypothetical protein
MKKFSRGWLEKNVGSEQENPLAGNPFPIFTAEHRLYGALSAGEENFNTRDVQEILLKLRPYVAVDNFNWEKFFVFWPRKINDKWVWLKTAERAFQAGGGGLGGDFWFIYR